MEAIHLMRASKSMLLGTKLHAISMHHDSHILKLACKTKLLHQLSFAVNAEL